MNTINNYIQSKICEVNSNCRGSILLTLSLLSSDVVVVVVSVAVEDLLVVWLLSPKPIETQL